jgi:signal transduction histidine kinase
MQATIQQPPVTVKSGPESGAVLSLHMALSALCGFVVTLIWGLTGLGYFWPMWVWFGLGVPLALHATVRHTWRAVAPGRTRRIAMHGALSAWAGSTLLVIWVLSGGGTFWPVWPFLGLGVVLALHALLIGLHDRLNPGPREQALVERVDELARTRRGALDVQAAELRRIERDLHDGAQARLVALTMKLGRAEEKLEDQPELADLVRQARSDASTAIAELRDLARGIAPPVLADRGLVAAAEALGRRAAIPVTVDSFVSRRPPPVVETAAYFVVAESLTNVAKHAGGAAAHVTLVQHDGKLLIDVTDEGPGGADPSGGGLSGLRGRVEALDGTLRIASPAGRGTRIQAELPCES